MKVKDLRKDEDTELGNIMEASGDLSMGFFTTDKGYRIIVDAYNMKEIADQYNKGAKGK